MFWRFFTTFWLLVAFPAVAMAETRVDINRQKNFSEYRTFTIEVSPLVRNGEVDEGDTITDNRLREAAGVALSARGLTQVESGGDLTVRVRMREDERTELMGPGAAFYPYGWYGPWGYGYGSYWASPWGGSVWAYRYLEGTTTFDVIETATGDRVYRAEVIDEVDDDEEDLDRDARKVAHKAFRKFPAGAVFIRDDD
jgi:hypothetical protein